MSRRHGERPGYGWSTQQQGGYKRPSATRHLKLKSQLTPTNMHNHKSTLNRARRENWRVESQCSSCKRKSSINALELILLKGISENITLIELKEMWKGRSCPNCKNKNTTDFVYTL